jgi:E3 ubiquitin-protein ligase HECTD1
MWLCDDGDVQQAKLEENELDLGEGLKPPGYALSPTYIIYAILEYRYYVRRAGGLFPAPLPKDSENCRRAAQLFRAFGIFLAKILQDGRIVDLPLARPLLKLLVSEQVGLRH